MPQKTPANLRRFTPIAAFNLPIILASFFSRGGGDRALVEHESPRGYPLNSESQKELKLVQSVLNLNDQKIGEVSRPILTQKEREYRERQKQLEQQRKLEQKQELKRKKQEEKAFASIQTRAMLGSMLGSPITIISTVTLVFFVLVWLFVSSGV